MLKLNRAPPLEQVVVDQNLVRRAASGRVAPYDQLVARINAHGHSMRVRLVELIKKCAIDFLAANAARGVAVK